MVVPLPTKVSINISSVYFFILGSPIPAPKPRARTLSGAVEYPSFIANVPGDDFTRAGEASGDVAAANNLGGKYVLYFSDSHI